ncbi:unnamed protein product, partial [Mesorhabditis spiculigera]
MCSHQHHDHDSHVCEAHEEDALNFGRLSLNSMIDHAKLVTYNESVEGSGAKVFRADKNGTDRDAFVTSDADEELLFIVPFSGRTKVTGIAVGSQADSSSPAKIRLFANKPNMTFDDCRLQPDQELELQKDPKGDLFHSMKATKFGALTHLVIHVAENFGSDSTRINYIELRGEKIGEIKDQVVIAVYESRALKKDHKNIVPDGVKHDIM